MNEQIVKRLARIEGHVRSVSKMVTEKRQTELIEQQILAIKKALDGVSKELLIEEVNEWIKAGETNQQIIEKQIRTFLR